MKIQEAFSFLVEAASQPDTNEDAIYDSLETAGVPFNLADKLYKFTQIAWGRVVLDGLKITFPQDYYCLDADGSVIESGRLQDEPHYSFAVSCVSRYVGLPVFEFLAVTSSEVGVVNQALHDRAKPEDLILLPPIIFLEAPTELGLQKGQELISKHIQLAKSQSPQKPWWKIWGS